MYDVRLAARADEAALTTFIDEHWRPNHIFVQSKELLDWQHRNKDTGEYNFVIGVHKESGEIHGVLGFITLNQFDPEIPFTRLIWMAIWKVRDAARGHRLGRNILSYLEDTVKPDIISTVAASAMTLAMYEARGYQVGRLNQDYILNPDIASFKLASVGKNRPAITGMSNDNKTMVPATQADIESKTADCFAAQEELPQKTPAYLINRYFQHPIYSYESYLVCEGEQVIGVIILRVCSHEGAKALRIVEFIGPASVLHGLQGNWAGLLREFGAEYIDFYSAGIAQSDMKASGFTRCTSDDGIIIPNYFEPFVQQKVEIDYMTSVSKGTKYRVVKGDSDQDRPNFIKGA